MVRPPMHQLVQGWTQTDKVISREVHYTLKSGSQLAIATFRKGFLSNARRIVPDRAIAAKDAVIRALDIRDKHQEIERIVEMFVELRRVFPDRQPDSGETLSDRENEHIAVIDERSVVDRRDHFEISGSFPKLGFLRIIRRCRRSSLAPFARSKHHQRKANKPQTIGHNCPLGDLPQ